MNRESYLLRHRQQQQQPKDGEEAGPTLLDSDEQEVVVASLANECTHQATLFSVRCCVESSPASLMYKMLVVSEVQNDIKNLFTKKFDCCCCCILSHPALFGVRACGSVLKFECFVAKKWEVCCRVQGLLLLCEHGVAGESASVAFQLLSHQAKFLLR